MAHYRQGGLKLGFFFLTWPNTQSSLPNPYLMQAVSQVQRLMIAIWKIPTWHRVILVMNYCERRPVTHAFASSSGSEAHRQDSDLQPILCDAIDMLLQKPLSYVGVVQVAKGVSSVTNQS